jgi:hypothetical protein
VLSFTTTNPGQQMLREMREFGKLPLAAQRYIRRSLHVLLGETATLAKIARTPHEARSIRRQVELYERIDEVIASIPVDDDIASITRFTSLIAPLVAFDVGEQKLESFAAFSYLYERLFGASIRPWLPAIFLMSASLPELHPNRRLNLLRSLDAEVVTAHWSTREPQFAPQWIEQVAV